MISEIFKEKNILNCQYFLSVYLYPSFVFPNICGKMTFFFLSSSCSSQQLLVNWKKKKRSDKLKAEEITTSFLEQVEVNNLNCLSLTLRDVYILYHGEQSSHGTIVSSVIP